MDKLQTLAQNIFNEIKDLNIDTISHCLTRIRISFNGSLPNIDNIKKIDGVKGVVTLGKEIQIVVGTQINQVYDYIKPLLDNKESNQQLKDTPLSQQNFDAVKNKYRKFNLLQTLGKFSKIFSPLIQAFVGAGIVAGIASLFLINQDTYGNWKNPVMGQWYQFFQLFLSAWSSAFLIIVGWRFMDIFGGKNYVGGLIGGIYSGFSANVFAAMFKADADGSKAGVFLGIHTNNVNTFWLTSGLTHSNFVNDQIVYSIGSPTGTMIGVIIAAILGIYLEKIFSKWIKGQLAYALIPICIVISLMITSLFIIIPISGYIIFALSWLFEHLTSGYVAIFGCMLLTFVFLFCLIFGIHTCFIPIYVALMSTQGVNFVFPLLGMAGAAQVGTAIILSWLSKKGSKFRKDIGACIVSGVLGIDEPLLYGVNLPRIIPLFTAAMGAAVGGLFIGLMVSPIANIHMGVQQVFGVNGVWGLITVVSNKGTPIWAAKIVYGSGWIISMIFGGLFTFVGYRIFKNNKKINFDLL